MPEVTYDEIPLKDERKVRAILKRLGAAPVGPELQVMCRDYWERYLYLDRRPYFFWRDGNDVWLIADEKAGWLRRVVISGLGAKKVAELLRSEVHRLSVTSGML